MSPFSYSPSLWCLPFSLQEEVWWGSPYCGWGGPTSSGFQVGVGIPNGAEAIVHSIKLLLSESSIPPGSKFCLSLDFSNAFNTIDRSVLFKEIRSRIPSLSRWLECCYGDQPRLLFGDYTILSCCGVQQGDPLGPLAFSILLLPLIERIKAEVPELLLHAWYLDDGILCGSPTALLKALDIIDEVGPSLGLSLNQSKCLIFAPPASLPSSVPLPDNIPFTSDGFVVLGAPVGPPNFCVSVIRMRIEKIFFAIEPLSLLEDAHSEYVLLRSCLSLPKLQCVLRSTSPEVLLSIIGTFDEHIALCLSNLIGGGLSPWSLLKATLPVRLGGIGLRQASLHAPAIFLASVSACSPLILSLSGLE
ncbi:PREDICTED: uncharacterized protein LOC109587260, partial [Amphimedon queenslandica]|uniref:Reverse transcriptase domain-containing protein n=1 Tax=Amphimedon queenslandica TaxID=400682 RepID=A0AAN0JPT9_AMPQE